MILWSAIVLAVAAVLSRGGRHPRLLRGAVAYFLTSAAIFLLVASSPNLRITSAEAYGIPVAVGLVVGLIPWARLVPLMKYPSALGVLVAWVVSLGTLAYPVAIYMTWRYATGHRPTERLEAGETPVAQGPSNATSVLTEAPAAPNAAATKVCPDCAETVLVAARVCRFCRYEFPSPETVEALVATPTESEAQEPVAAAAAAVGAPMSAPARLPAPARRDFRSFDLSSTSAKAAAVAMLAVVILVVVASVGASALGITSGPTPRVRPDCAAIPVHSPNVGPLHDNPKWDPMPPASVDPAWPMVDKNGEFPCAWPGQ